MSSINQFETARNCFYVYVFGKSSVLFQRLNCAFEQFACHFRIPFGDYDSEAHVACIGNFRQIVFRKVV